MSYIQRRIDWRLGLAFDDLGEPVKPLVNADSLKRDDLFKAGLTQQIAPSSAGKTAHITGFEEAVVGLALAVTQGLICFFIPL
jgi:hypothetical protein